MNDSMHESGGADMSTRTHFEAGDVVRFHGRTVRWTINVVSADRQRVLAFSANRRQSLRWIPVDRLTLVERQLPSELEFHANGTVMSDGEVIRSADELLCQAVEWTTPAAAYWGSTDPSVVSAAVMRDQDGQDFVMMSLRGGHDDGEEVALSPKVALDFARDLMTMLLPRT